MTEPINLTQLREDAEKGNGDLYGYDAPAHEILLALIDTAEAAIALELGARDISVRPEDLARLRETLNHYTTTPNALAPSAPQD